MSSTEEAFTSLFPDVDPDTAVEIFKEAESGDYPMLELYASMTENCAHLKASDGMTLLMRAARASGRPTEGHGVCAEYLLQLAGDCEARSLLANAVDRSGKTCLHHAAASDNVWVMEAALLAGADVNRIDNEGQTALLVAVKHGRKNAAALLLKAGADQLHCGEGKQNSIELVEQLEAEIKKLASLKKETQKITIYNEVMKQGSSAAILKPLMEISIELLLPSATDADLLLTMATKVGDVMLLLQRWFSRSIPDFVEVPANQKQQKSNMISVGSHCDLYTMETEPPNLPIVVRVLRVGTSKRIFELEKGGLEALKTAKHRNIAQLLRFREEPSTYTIVQFLERIDGITIQEQLERTGPFAERQIRRYIRQVASALCYMHSHPNGPIIHRDIRCENIMLTRGGLVKLIDFGFALFNGSIAITSSELIGCLAYMAPEIHAHGLSGNSIIKFSRKSDVWATGCVLFAMAMGLDTFQSQIENLRSIEHGMQGLLLEIHPPENYSSGLLDLCQRCMEKDPARRTNATGILLHQFITKSSGKILLYESIYEWAEDLPLAIDALKEMGIAINESYKKSRIAKVAGAAMAIAGGAAAIVGYALLIPSLGAALPLAISGTAVAISGGSAAAVADIADRLVQNKKFNEAATRINQFRESTERLLLGQLELICSSVQLHITETNSAIGLTGSKVLIKGLSEKVNQMIGKLEESGLLDAMRTQYKEQTTNPVDELLANIKEPINKLKTNLETCDRTGPTDEQSTAEFNRNLQQAIKFFTRLLKILWFGSADGSTDLYVDQVKSALRATVGGTQIALEVAGIAGMSIAGRVLGIVGSAVFTAVDIGFLAKYSVELHRARRGEYADKAKPIFGQIELIEKLLDEAARLDREEQAQNASE